MSPSIHTQIQNAFQTHENELIALHRRLVSLRTVNQGDGSPVEEILLAREAAEYLAQAGVTSRIVESAPGRANLLAEIDSGTPGETILWMSHADVVPEGDPDAWTHPPFSAALADGRIWGRGSYDCKMMVACELFAMAQMARLGLPRRGKIRLAIGADEETGGAQGFGWLIHHEADFLTADLAVNEGGGSTLGFFDQGRPVLSLGSGERGRCELIFTLTSPGGHAGAPLGKVNPLIAMAQLIGRLGDWAAPARTDVPILRSLGPLLGVDAPLTPGGVDALIADLRRDNPALATSIHAQTHMTITPTIFAAGEKSNAIPTRAELRCDARLVPGQSPEDLETAVREIIEGLPGVTYRIEIMAESSQAKVDEKIVDRFGRAASRALEREVTIAPTWCTGFTDARFVRKLGTPVYGFQMIHPEADPNRQGIHCIDESIETIMLLPCALSLAHLALDDED